MQRFHNRPYKLKIKVFEEKINLFSRKLLNFKIIYEKK
jgi:hypothetical protein